MNFFDALAVLGAAGALAQIWAVWRDRPRIKLNFGFATSMSGPPRVWVTVLNDGRQPVTIRDAGFYASQMPVEINSQEFGPARGTAFWNMNMLDEPLLLDPARQHKMWSTVPDSFTMGYHVDFPLRLYAIDAGGRWVWGDAAPVVRMVIGSGPCPDGFPPYLWDPTSEPLQSARVVSRWHVWRKRELRRGDRDRPSAQALANPTRQDLPVPR